MISAVIEALCVGIMCAVCYRIGWNKGYRRGKARYYDDVTEDGDINGFS